MTSLHRRSTQNLKYKTAYCDKNRVGYGKALHDRDEITIWIRQDVLDAWTAPNTGKRDAQLVYFDTVIEIVPKLRRQTKDFLHPLLRAGLFLFYLDPESLLQRNVIVEICQFNNPGLQGPD